MFQYDNLAFHAPSMRSIAFCHCLPFPYAMSMELMLITLGWSIELTTIDSKIAKAKSQELVLPQELIRALNVIRSGTTLKLGMVSYIANACWVLLPLITGTDDAVERNDIHRNLCVTHQLKESDGMSPVATLLARADPRIEADGVTWFLFSRWTTGTTQASPNLFFPPILRTNKPTTQPHSRRFGLWGILTLNLCIRHRGQKVDCFPPESSLEHRWICQGYTSVHLVTSSQCVRLEAPGKWDVHDLRKLKFSRSVLQSSNSSLCVPIMLLSQHLWKVFWATRGAWPKDPSVSLRHLCVPNGGVENKGLWSLFYAWVVLWFWSTRAQRLCQATSEVVLCLHPYRNTCQSHDNFTNYTTSSEWKLLCPFGA